MIFGKYAVLDNATHKFEKEESWTWTFRPTSSADELTIAKFIQNNTKETIVDGKVVRVPPDWIEIAWRELAISFGGTTIPQSEEDPTPILHPDATVEQIEVILKQMPLPMVVELWSALAEANPLWGPRLAPKENETEPKSLES